MYHVLRNRINDKIFNRSCIDLLTLKFVQSNACAGHRQTSLGKYVQSNAALVYCDHRRAWNLDA